MRHLAWLDSAPKNQKKPRRYYFAQDAASNYLNMPDVAGFRYVVDLMFDVVGHNGGLIQLDMQEIEAWSHMSGIDLTAWEASTIRNMSRAYVVQFNRSNDSMESPPYYEDSGKVDVSAKFKALATRQAK